MKLGISMKTVKELAPVAGGVLLYPTATNLLSRVPMMNTAVFANLTVSDVVVSVAGLMVAKRKGIVGGVGKGLVLAVLVKAASGFVSGALNSALGPSSAVAADTF